MKCACGQMDFEYLVQEFAKITEGVCPSCDVPSERTSDGMALCPCCGVAWQLDGQRITVVFPIHHAQSQLATSGANPGDQPCPIGPRHSDGQEVRE